MSSESHSRRKTLSNSLKIRGAFVALIAKKHSSCHGTYILFLFILIIQFLSTGNTGIIIFELAFEPVLRTNLHEFIQTTHLLDIQRLRRRSFLDDTIKTFLRLIMVTGDSYTRVWMLQ
jgi:hypothetical protein